MSTYTITTTRFSKNAGRIIEHTISVLRAQAILTASRLPDPTTAITAPRGQKGSLLDAARLVKKSRSGVVRGEYRDPLSTPLVARANTRLVAIYSEVIESRGGETTIEEKSRSIPLAVQDRAHGMTLLSASGWRHYSSRFGARPATITYLCGRDDNGRWAVRVPGTVATVAEALDAITPAPVKKALEAGRPVLRQGDVYAIETTKAHDGKGDLPDRHEWDASTRTLRHLDAENAHGSLHISFPVRFITQSTLRMGRTARRGRGD
jgi:hypothetical protein